MGEKARAKTMEKREAVSWGFTVELWGDKHLQFVERMPKGASGNSTRDASYKKRNKAKKKKPRKGAVQKKTTKTGRQANKSRSKSRAKGKYRT